MRLHSRPEADKFIEHAKRLRNKNAGEDEIVGASEALYPDPIKHRYKRSRFKRACLVSDASFARAVAVYDAGGNIGDIVAALETTSAAGAPKGNINARGKKRDFSMKRLNGTWRTMTRAEKDEFLQANGLKRI